MEVKNKIIREFKDDNITCLEVTCRCGKDFTRSKALIKYKSKDKKFGGWIYCEKSCSTTMINRESKKGGKGYHKRTNLAPNPIKSGVMVGEYQGKEKPMSHYNSQGTTQDYLDSLELEPIEGLKDNYKVCEHDRQLIGRDMPYKN